MLITNYTKLKISMCIIFFIYSGKISLSSTPQEDTVSEIAISLDDAPMPGSVLFGGVARTQSIIEKLQEVNSPPIMIFALGVHAQRPIDMERLGMYATAGHLIANPLTIIID